MLSRRTSVPLCAFTFALTVAACTQPPPDVKLAPTPASAAALAQVDSAMHRYNALMRSGAPDSIAALFTRDGELFDSDNALEGRSAIRAFFAPLTRSVRVQSSNSTTHAFEVWGNTALQWGEYEENAERVGGPLVHYRGRFVAEWQHQSNGRWLVRRMLMQPLNGG